MEKEKEKENKKKNITNLDLFTNLLESANRRQMSKM